MFPLESQDFSESQYKSFRLGIGIETVFPTYGFDAILYYKKINASVFLGMPFSSNKTSRVRNVDYMYNIRLGYDFAAFQNENGYTNFYFGSGFSYINEKDIVKGFSGNGTINGVHFFIGGRILTSTVRFLKSIGGHIELGLNTWEFSNSVLFKNNANVDYNFPKIYYSFGIYYYIK